MDITGFFASTATVNVNAVSSIREVDETFFYESFKCERYIQYGKAKNHS
ncbi:MAG: hypothetical protein ACEY3J_01215 [Arsenophonus sp.]